MNTWCNRTKLRGLLTAFLLSAALGEAAVLKPGDAFPELSRFGLEGTLPDCSGKVVLVDFFASWCGPCKDSFPVMQEFYKKYADRGFIILAVNVDKKKEDMDDFLKKHAVDFPVVRDAANKLVSEVRIPTMPSSFLLDREGRVAAVHRGFKGEETRKQYAEEIEALLKGTKP
jgi:thiol-disulfide isomerase/thioredoxin